MTIQMEIHLIQSAIDSLEANIGLGSKQNQHHLQHILEELQQLLEDERKHVPIPNSLENFRRMIEEDRKNDDELTCEYFRHGNEVDYWYDQYNFYDNDVDFETYQEFVRSKECICGFCGVPKEPSARSPSPPRYVPVPQEEPKEPEVTLNVVMFDENRKWYRELTHNFILYQTDDRIRVLCVLDGDKMRPLTEIEIGLAESMGLFVESGRLTKGAKRAN